MNNIIGTIEDSSMEVIVEMKEAGPQGIPGDKGDKGDKGDPGEKGEKGDTGKSLEFTWNGTQLGIRQEGEASYQYVNLKGEKGDTGEKGDKGDTGEQGVPGLDGKSLEFHWNGTQLGIRIEGETTYQYVNLKGEKGDTGAKGDKGEKGDKGDKPAHRWIDTSLQIENPDGTWGDAVNLKGDKGDTGAAGKSLEFLWAGTQLGVRQEGQTNYIFAELKGPKGDKGDKGEQGPKGDKGDPGESPWVSLGRFYSVSEVIVHIVMNQITSGNYVFEIPFGDDPSQGFATCIILISLHEYYTPPRLIGTLYSADGLVYNFSLNPYTGQLYHVKILRLHELMTDITDQFS